MRISERVRTLPPYLFAGIERQIAERGAAGIDVISLGIGDPDLPTPPHIVEALAKAGGAESPALMRKAALDAHPSVRAAALAGLGDLKDRALLEFFKERFAKDGSDAVRAESLRAIGKLGDPSTVPFLDQCAAVPSYRNLIATAAKQAIAAAGIR
jgi:HEAT repeat protein